MATQNQGQQALFSSADGYNAAVQLHNNEFRTLGERANAFLLTQSILIAAFFLIRINQEEATIPFVIITMVVILIGIAFCVLHIRAGRSGAYAAYGWRKYMLHLENKYPDAPWNWFSKYFEDKSKKAEGANCFIKFYGKHLWWLTGEGSLAKCLPLPSSWLFSPPLFLLVWTGATAYIFILYFQESLKLCIAFAVIVAISLSFAGCLTYQNWKAWKHPNNGKE